jgi:hypothetical protein
MDGLQKPKIPPVIDKINTFANKRVQQFSLLARQLGREGNYCHKPPQSFNGLTQ